MGDSDYTIAFARSARKELERLEAEVVSRLFPKIELLAQQPRPRGCRKLAGRQGLWRIRIGDYRVVYSIDDVAKVVDIIAIRHRSDVYDH